MTFPEDVDPDDICGCIPIKPAFVASGTAPMEDVGTYVWTQGREHDHWRDGVLGLPLTDRETLRIENGECPSSTAHRQGIPQWCERGVSHPGQRHGRHTASGDLDYEWGAVQ